MEVQQAETSVRLPWIVGATIVGVTFGMFGLWALIAPLQGAALAPGMVEVKGNRKVIQHLEGGIVEEILVKDGDPVKAGELLVKLDDTQSKAQLEIALVQFYNTQAIRARLESERDGLDAVAYPPALADNPDPRARDAIANQDQVFNSRMVAHLGEISVLEQRVEQLTAQIEGTRGLKKGNEQMATSFQEEVKDFRELLEEGYADKNRLRELERSLARTESEIAENISRIASLEMSVGETRMQILQLTKDMQEQIVEQLTQALAEYYDLEERIRALRDAVERTSIRSPVDGVVLNLSVHTIGGVVGPGVDILSVVPEGQELIVSARVAPPDIDRVHKGQLADIRFSAFSAQTVPVIEGLLTQVSADALTDQQTGDSYYLAKVEVTEEGFKKLEGLELLPGMPAEVLINTGDRTLFQYLTKPISNAFARSLIED